MIKNIRKLILRAYFERGYRKNLQGFSQDIDPTELMSSFRRNCDEDLDFCWNLAKEIVQPDTTGVDQIEALKSFEAVSEDCRSKENFFDGKTYQLGGLDLEMPVIYYSVLISRSRNVMEIGVANGCSSAFLYDALDQIDGAITSIDLPRFSDSLICRLRAEAFEGESRKLTGTVQDIYPGGIIPSEKWAGWFVDPKLRLKVRNTTFYGNMFSILPELDSEFYDLVVFDAMKDYDARMRAFALIDARLSSGGICFVDGYWVNNAFKDFCEQNTYRMWCFGRVGVFRKAVGS